MRQSLFLKLHVYVKPYGFIRAAFFGNPSGIKNLYFSFFTVFLCHFWAASVILGLAGSCGIAFALGFAISQTAEKAKLKKVLVTFRPRFVTRPAA